MADTDSLSSRDRILNRIATAGGRDRVASLDARPEAVDNWLAAHRRHTLPAMPGDLVKRLVHEMQAALISVDDIASIDQAPDAVARYLDSLAKLDVGEAPHSKDLERITIAPALAHLDWPFRVEVGAASGEESVGITPCFAAIAETGSLVLASSDECPMTLAFLPEIHVVLLHRDQIVGRMEDAHARIRQRNRTPRGLNVITGPSRTADIEQTLEIGAHGPRYMHVLLIDTPANAG